MVFPGRFSSGCGRCRQRKIKCDESKPSCRRCYIYGQPCPGYTDRFHFRFESCGSKQENISPRTRSEKSPARNKPQPQPHPKPPVPQLSTAIVPTRAIRSIIAPNPQVSYDQVSLCYFVRRFVTPCEADSFPGHLSFLPGLYNHHDHGLLEVATLAVAQMAAYNQFGGDRFRLHSYQNYGRAVRVLRETIHVEKEVTDDRVIAAILLLCMFKDISGEGQGDPCEHASGLYYLLEKRGTEQLCTGRGIELFLLSLIKLHAHSFMQQDDSYGDPGGLVAWLGLFDPMMRAMSLMAKCLCLRHNLSKCRTSQNNLQSRNGGQPQVDDENNPNGTIACLLRACFETLEEFDNWDLDAEYYWKHTFEGRSVPASLGEISTSATFYDPETACTIILVRSARLVLLSSILEHYESMQVMNSNARIGTINDKSGWVEFIPILTQSTRLAIDDMLWCVPFALGDLDANGHPVSMPHDGAAALIILQPMRLVTYCPFATSEQRRRSQVTLDRMNLGIGVRAAVSWEQ